MSKDANKELEDLYAKGQDELRAVKRANTFKNAKGRARDVMIHIAVTIMPDVEGNHVAGEKENEIGQFAVRVPARWITRGLTEKQCKMAFEGLTFRAYERMRLFGLVRAGE